MEQELYKTRSAAACVKAAYHRLYDQRRAVFRKMWLPSLCYAVAIASAYVPYVQFVSLLLIVAAALWYYARVFTLLNDLSERKNCLKLLKSYLVYAAIAFLTIILFGAIVFGLLWLLPQPATEGHCGMYFIGYFAVATVVGGIVALLLVALPLSYFLMKYMVEDVSLRKNLWPGCKTGLRHWGLLFLTALIIGLVLTVVYLVVFMPQFILFGAQMTSTTGVLMGDEA
ncbi:MAG: hypothetical protein IJ605_06665 [Prevotella sp.]|nr:hypothetical protein [Prevotella sp.]